MTAAAAAIALSAGSAWGGFIQWDAPITIEADSAVSATLVGAFAGAAGDIYFVGSVTDGAYTPAPDTFTPGVGTRLFGSKAAVGTTVELGTFSAGTELHFGYVVTTGWGTTVLLGDVMRSDVLGDQAQFGYDPEASSAGRWSLGIEDIRDPKKSDWDYNDAMFDLVITPVRDVVPTPGTATLLAAGGVLAGVRRRR